MEYRRILQVVVSTLFVAATAGAASPARDAKAPAVIQRATGKLATMLGLAPLGGGVGIVSSHNPYAEGDCSFCHKGNDARNPGPILKSVNDLCYDCHSEHADIMMKGSVKHPPSVEACTNCHNPHNSKQKALLLDEVSLVCASCHPKVKELMDTAKVKHMPVVEGRKCSNCHNPHATNVEKLLTALPFDQCVKCHSVDGMKDPQGVVLTNFKKLLDKNPVQHAPVAGKDCSACHVPHGNDNFRLLTQAYPASFYAPYDPANYALCYECHNPDILQNAETTTLTKFRDGARNLHYLHVNKPDRGRTCRSCHEVHASTHPYQVRDAVPYGSKGWMLQINFKKTPTGGSCEKTCHSLKPYDNTTRVVAPQPATANKKK